MGNRMDQGAGALLAAGFVLGLAGCSAEVKTGGSGNSAKTPAVTQTDPAKATASVTFNVTGMT